MKNPSVPGSVPGPASIPDIWSLVRIQATPAKTTSRPISPTWISPGSGGTRRMVADSMAPLCAESSRHAQAAQANSEAENPALAS